MEPSANELMVELDGPGVEPETVDPRILVGLAGAYLTLIEKVAEDQELKLEMKGLRLLNKCAALSTYVGNPTAAWAVVSSTNEYLAGSKAPYGVRTAVDGVRRVLKEVPPEYTASVHVGEHVASLSDILIPEPSERPWALTTMWVRPVRVGGRRDRVQLESDSERDLFSVDVDLALAKQIGGHLKEDLLVELQITRDEDGRIEGGRLLSFALPDVEPGHEFEAWEKWFKASVDGEATLKQLHDSGEE